MARTLVLQHGIRHVEGVRWLTEKQISAVGADVRGWLLEAGAFIPVGWAGVRGCYCQRLIPLTSSSIGLWSRRCHLLLGISGQEHADALQPRCLAAEGVVRRSCSPKRLLSGGEQLWLLKVDLAGAFGPMQFPRDMAEIAKENGPCRCAGGDDDHLWTCVYPALAGVGGGGSVPVYKGCKQGAPESQPLWNVMLDETMAPLLRKRQRAGRGAYLPSLIAGDEHCRPRTWADVAQTCNQLAYADDHLVGPEPQGHPADVQRLGEMCCSRWASD